MLISIFSSERSGFGGEKLQLGTTRDPGGNHGKGVGQTKHPTMTITNNHVSKVLVSSTMEADENMRQDDGDSRMELNSHASMAVVSRNCYILAETQRHVDVNLFMPVYPPIKAQLVDVAIQYDSPYDGKSHILVIRNAIHMPLMKNNLLPPFMLSEAGITVNDKAKIHLSDSSMDNHAIVFPETGFRIHLSLWGVFSYFSFVALTTHIPARGEGCVHTQMWNPRSEVFSTNKESMMDWEGNMQDPKDWKTHLVFDDIEDIPKAFALMVSSLETSMVNKKYEQQNEFDDTMQQINCTISSASSVLDHAQMCQLVERRAQLGRDQMIIGVMHACFQSNLILHDKDEGKATSNEESLSTEEMPPDDWESNTNLDEAFIAGVDVSRAGEPDVKHLSKMWQISYKDAKCTLDLMTQHSVHTQDPTLSQNYMGQTMTSCSTSGLGNVSLWTLSLPHPRVESHPGGTHAVSSLSLTRVLFMWFL